MECFHCTNDMVFTITMLLLLPVVGTICLTLGDD